MLCEIGVPPLIFLRLLSRPMRIAVHFNAQLGFVAIEVEGIRPKRMLVADLRAVK